MTSENTLTGIMEVLNEHLDYAEASSLLREIATVIEEHSSDEAIAQVGEVIVALATRADIEEVESALTDAAPMIDWAGTRGDTNTISSTQREWKNVLVKAMTKLIVFDMNDISARMKSVRRLYANEERITVAGLLSEMPLVDEGYSLEDWTVVQVVSKLIEENDFTMDRFKALYPRPKRRGWRLR